jgi:hypothetical protein
MKQSVRSSFGRQMSLLACGSALVLQSLCAKAQISTFSSGNSSVSVNLGTQAGMFNWSVESQNQLAQQWFWFRTGSGIAASLDTLPLISHSVVGGNQLNALYGNGTFTIGTVFTLNGGAVGSGSSIMSEQVTINNLTGTALPFHLFEYANFPLNSPSVNVTNSTDGGGHFNDAYVSSTSNPNVHIQETTIAPPASEGEAALTPSTLTSLNGTAGYVLNNNPIAGPGAGTFAFEWDTSVAGSGSYQISKNLDIEGVSPIPEPAVLSLASFGLVGLGLLGRRFRRSK